MFRYLCVGVLVVSGKPYATCRYEVFDTSAPLDVTTLWYIVGKGIPAQVTNTAGTTVLQIKSGTYKDAPL